MRNKNVRGIDYLYLALYAFGGLGLEVLLAFVIEPKLYGDPMSSWSTLQNISHWIMTCTIWAIMIFYLVKESKDKYDFNILSKSEKMKNWQWIMVIISIIFMIVLSYIDWDGFKVIKEYNNKGLLEFIFQYIYYWFETGLFMLIIVFGQKAFEKWFNNKLIPYGGIAVALTWGVSHIFTKGDIKVGLLSVIGGFIFGTTYLLVNRDIKKTYILLFIMFTF